MSSKSTNNQISELTTPSSSVDPAAAENKAGKKTAPKSGSLSELAVGLVRTEDAKAGRKVERPSKERGTTSKLEMYNKFQPWVLATYGDSAKTKTITKRKAARIAALLSSSKESLEPAGSDAAKFRLWVKSKGLQLAARNNKEDSETDEPLLIVPSGTDKTLDGKVHFVYKKVAVVENFFDIIYSVHVESIGDVQLRGRAGKHCGQKRTYRAVADQYAFIPREAVSRFLLYCTECQRKQPAGQSLETSPRPNQENTGTVSCGQPDVYKMSVSPIPIKSADELTDQAAQEPGLPSSRPTHIKPAGHSSSEQTPADPNRTYQDGATKTTDYSDPSAAAAHAHAIAYAQAINALQSFSSPRLYPPTPSVFPSPTSFTGSVIYQPSSIYSPSPSPDNLEIDLSLPITSTYLKRLKGREVNLAEDYCNLTYIKKAFDVTEVKFFSLMFDIFKSKKL